VGAFSDPEFGFYVAAADHLPLPAASSVARFAMFAIADRAVRGTRSTHDCHGRTHSEALDDSDLLLDIAAWEVAHRVCVAYVATHDNGAPGGRWARRNNNEV